MARNDINSNFYKIAVADANDNVLGIRAAVGNVQITGGANGQVLSTNGSGVLSWTTSASRSAQLVSAGVDVTLGNLKARVAASGARSLQLSTVTGTYQVYGTITGVAGGGGFASYINSSTPVAFSTTPTQLTGASLNTGGDSATYNLVSAASGLAWRITIVIGTSYTNCLVSIEQLV